MTGTRDAEDRYRAAVERNRGRTEPAPSPAVLNAETMPAIVETAIQVAIRRGEFDDLPGAGKPLEGLAASSDPDWWIRRKIEREGLTGLGPPALLLRVEDRRMEETLDALGREEDVRALIEDFNRRVVEARRQLQGGPPVVTRTRDADAEVAAWRQRREARHEAPTAEPDEQRPRRRWFSARRARD
ncbi:DnaJ family domain-containing protein [Microbacterium resistens]